MAALRRWAAAALAAVLLLAAAGPARAHAGLRSTTPAAGDTVRGSPPRLTLRFTEPVDAAQSGLRLLRPDGTVTVLLPQHDAGDVTAITSQLPPLAPGGYRVEWRTLSADGHPVDGSFVFYVAGDGTAASPRLAPPPAERAETKAAPPVPLLAAVLRGLGVGALACLVGLLVMVISSAAGDERVRRLALAMAWAAPLLLAAHALAWAAYARGGHGDGHSPLTHLLFQTGPGHLEMSRAALALLALWALALARMPKLALGFALVAVLATGVTGHPAAIHPAWTIPTKALHVAALAVWLGGLAALSTTAREGDGFRAMALRASSLALAAVLLILATGVVETLVLAPSLPLLVKSAYGAVLLAKLLGFAALVAMGARNRFRLVPRLPADDALIALRRSVRWELAVMAMVLLAAGVLAYVPVPRPPEPADPSVPVSHS